MQHDVHNGMHRTVKQVHQNVQRYARGGIAMLGAVAGFMSTAGCGSDTAGPPTGVAKFRVLRLNYHAITLATIAPADTVTLVATPQTSDGTPLPASGPVSFVSSDTAVQVSASGKLQARTTTTTTNIQIVASMTIGGVQGITLKDTAYVNVVAQSSAASIPVVTGLSIQPVAGDSAARSIDSIPPLLDPEMFWPPRVTDASNNNIPSVRVAYSAVNTRVFTYEHDALGNDTWRVRSPGRVIIRAEALVYGTLVTDSCVFTVGYPSKANIFVDTSTATGLLAVKAFPDTMIISLGGKVVWSNRLVGLPSTRDSVDIQFTDPTGAHVLLGPDTISASIIFYGPGPAVLIAAAIVPVDGSGNIAPFPPVPPPPNIGAIDTTVFGFYEFLDTMSARGRRFPTAGAYTYHSRFVPGTGVIKVVPNADLR